MKITRLFWLAISLVLAMDAVAIIAGTVTMDGSLPGSVSLSGATYTISAGRQSGANQFYSFQHLNLVQGDVASFTTPMSVSNVIARVTGGASSIDGTISVPNASFYLINNQGVIFGPDASLNVGGSFTVTTADELKFADGKVFTATPSGSDATLSTAAPAAFGFLSSSPAGITVNGGAITTDESGVIHLHPSLNPAGSLTVVGGNITINGGELATSGTGSATIVSVASSGTVTLSNPTDTSSFSSMGTITVESGGLLGSDASSTGGTDSGPVTVAAGTVTIDGVDATDAVRSTLGSYSGPGVAGPVTVMATGALTVTVGGAIRSDAINNAYGSGFPLGTDSGAVTISAASVTVSGTDADGRYSEIASFSGAGVAGSVTVNTAGALMITDGAEVGSDASVSESGTDSGSVMVSAGDVTVSGTGVADMASSRLASISGSGVAGSVTVTSTGTISISGGGELGSDASLTGEGTNSGSVTVSAGNVTVSGTDAAEKFFSEIGSFADMGTAGAVSVTSSGAIAVSGGGAVGSFSYGSDSGSVTISAQSATVTGADSLNVFSTLGSFSTGNGNAGPVNVTMLDGGSLTISGGAELGSDARGIFGITGGANSGSLTVTAGSVTVTGEDSAGNDSSLVSTGGVGEAGAVTLTVAGELTISGGGQVASVLTPLISPMVMGTSSGTVTVSAASVMIEGADASGFSSTIGSITGTGNGGLFTLTTQTLSILDGGEIDGKTPGAGTGGLVNVNVPGSITLDGQGSSGFTGIGAQTGQTTAGGGKGGDITVTAGTLSILNGAEIDASTFGTGAGGNVTVNTSGLLTLDAGTTSHFTSISAQSLLTTPGAGKGGDVTVTAGTLSILNSAKIDASTFGTGAGGSVTVNVSGLLTLNAGTTDEATAISAETKLTTAGGGEGGNVTVTAGTISVLSGAEIDASTFGTGAGGSVTVTTPGLLTLDAAAAGFAIISAESLPSTPGAGNGGNVTVTAGTLSVLNGASIDASTFGTGAGGSVTVNVSGALTLDAEATNDFTAISAESELATVGGGQGGDVVVTAGTLSVLNGAEIDASTSGTGAGGSVTVNTSGLLTLNAGGMGHFDGISAQSELITSGAGQGGDVMVTAGALSVLNGGAISATTFGPGAGGNCNVTVAGAMTLNGGAVIAQFTGVAAESALATPGGGKGGDVTVNAGSLTITNFAQLSAGTLGTGSGGDITVTAGTFLISNAGEILASTAGLGAAGDIHVVVNGAAQVNGGTSELSFNTGIFARSKLTGVPDAGNGGDITLNTQSLSLLNGAVITSASLGSGLAGSITINVGQSATLSNLSDITVSAPQNSSGDIDLVAGDNILIQHSAVLAFAADIGGDITLDAPNLITIANSLVDGQAGLSGGKITIDPQIVIIGPDSVVDGLSNGQDVLVTIQPTGGFLLSNDSQILTNRQVFSVNNDIAANLAVLQASLADVNAQLEPTCSMYATSDSSTLIETSNGGPPPAPGGWMPAPGWDQEPH